MEKWWKNAVVYQIYPASFQDSNGDGIGDLNGIISRLDYIKKLGVDIIWLNPIYKSPNVDNGYDVSDYQDIQPIFGDLKIFNNLLKQAHQHKIKVVMDLVVNHSSNQQKWFVESRKSKNNPYHDYYIWKDGDPKKLPNNWGSYFSGPAWTYDKEIQQYYMHLFAKEQPELNWKNPQMRKDVYRLMRWWFDKGIDGFRMDSISLLDKPDNYPDAPNPANATYADAQPIVADGKRLGNYLKEMNKEVLSKYNVVSIGEMIGSNVKDALEYTGRNNHELDMIFQFEHVTLTPNKDKRLGKWNDIPVNLVDLKNSLSKWQNGLNKQGWNSLYWNNHDQPRAVSRFGNDSPEYRELSAKMLATTLHMLKGTPYIYQGEELGMTNNHFKTMADYRDLETLNAYDELVNKEKIVSKEKMMSYFANMSRDNARTPMQWNNSKNAGFTTGTPWIEVNENKAQINAAAQINDPNSVFSYYQKLIQLRHKSSLIVYGDYLELDPNDDKVFAFKRTYKKQELLVISNFTAEELTRDYNQKNADSLVIGNYPDDEITLIRPYETKVYLFN
ncbi:glycoside hydrolase family 13 protein [Liquorilactobacillus satsumensis]|uniref:glycoside hydrolase family 13 protein n=1 Tax=Liquorilactobacillus TaxID=2767888 RepID=UPI001E3188C2|nr:alpha-glucosidase [Liquorilactobacillus satsumensis]MCC7667222.1 glucohydrolase [Liquorilactobacillus satsumensis]